MSENEGQVAIEVGVLLHQVYARATARLNAELRPMGLTSRHVSVMFLIRDGVETQRDLVAQLGTDKTGMVRVVDDLERLGHLTRTPSSTDRRVAILRLTNGGAEELRLAQQRTKAVADELFGPIGGADLGVLRSILLRVLHGSPPAAPGAGESTD